MMRENVPAIRKLWGPKRFINRCCKDAIFLQLSAVLCFRAPPLHSHVGEPWLRCAAPDPLCSHRLSPADGEGNTIPLPSPLCCRALRAHLAAPRMNTGWVSPGAPQESALCFNHAVIPLLPPWGVTHPEPTAAVAARREQCPNKSAPTPQLSTQPQCSRTVALHPSSSGWVPLLMAEELFTLG